MPAGERRIDPFTGQLETEPERPEPSGVERMRADVMAREETQRLAHEAAGLGFWRLVWIVALGILIAQGIAAGAIALFRLLAA